MIQSDAISDRAGKLYIPGNFLQTKTRIDRLIVTKIYIVTDFIALLLNIVLYVFINR